MSVRYLALVWCIAGVACTDVRVVDDGDPPASGGPPIGGTSGDGGAGVGPSGGAPVGGAPAPGLVPGCESLELAGEPMLIADAGLTTGSSPPSLTALDGGRAGLVFLYAGGPGGGDEELRSRTVDDAFEGWPPVVSEATTHDLEFFDYRFLLSAAPNGLFTLGPWSAGGIFSFDQAGAARSFNEAQAFLHPGEGTPFELVVNDFDNGGYSLLSYDSLDAPTPSNSVAFPLPDLHCHTSRMATGGDGPLFSIAPIHCDYGFPPHVDLYKKGADGVDLVGGFDLPEVPWEQSLARRPGGFWYFTSSIEGIGSRAYPLDENGALVEEPWIDEYTDDARPRFVPWRDGLVGSHRENEAVSLFVTDGVNRTESQAIPGTEGLENGMRLAMAIGGKESRAILVAYQVPDGIQLARLECFTPLK